MVSSIRGGRSPCWIVTSSLVGFDINILEVLTSVALKPSSLSPVAVFSYFYLLGVPLPTKKRRWDFTEFHILQTVMEQRNFFPARWCMRIIFSCCSTTLNYFISLWIRTHLWIYAIRVYPHVFSFVILGNKVLLLTLITLTRKTLTVVAFISVHCCKEKSVSYGLVTLFV